jgi:hypothetical protein
VVAVEDPPEPAVRCQRRVAVVHALDQRGLRRHVYAVLRGLWPPCRAASRQRGLSTTTGMSRVVPAWYLS